MFFLERHTAPVLRAATRLPSMSTSLAPLESDVPWRAASIDGVPYRRRTRIIEHRRYGGDARRRRSELIMPTISFDRFLAATRTCTRPGRSAMRLMGAPRYRCASATLSGGTIGSRCSLWHFCDGVVMMSATDVPAFRMRSMHSRGHVECRPIVGKRYLTSTFRA